MRPCRDGAKQCQNQDDEEDGGWRHSASPLLNKAAGSAYCCSTRNLKNSSTSAFPSRISTTWLGRDGSSYQSSLLLFRPQGNAALTATPQGSQPGGATVSVLRQGGYCMRSSVICARPMARLTPVPAETLTGCSAKESSEPPSSTLAPSPATKAAEAVAPE